MYSIVVLITVITIYTNKKDKYKNLLVNLLSKFTNNKSEYNIDISPENNNINISSENNNIGISSENNNIDISPENNNVEKEIELIDNFETNLKIETILDNYKLYDMARFSMKIKINILWVDSNNRLSKQLAFVLTPLKYSNIIKFVYVLIGSYSRLCGWACDITIKRLYKRWQNKLSYITFQLNNNNTGQFIIYPTFINDPDFRYLRIKGKNSYLGQEFIYN